MADNSSIPLAATDGTLEPNGPAEQLFRLWQHGERVDLDTFLGTAGQLSAGELAAVLRVDQRQRWQAGERILAESYFERYPDLRTDAEAAVDVIFQEFLLRQQLGECPDSRRNMRTAFRRMPTYSKARSPCSRPSTTWTTHCGNHGRASKP